MRKALIFIFCLLNWGVEAGTLVPSRLQFAGMDLQIEPDARRKIQESVDQLMINEKYFQKRLERMAMFFPIVDRVFAEEGLPEQFKYLAMQESGLVSDAVSTSNAVGFWQFKKESATELGLRIDDLVDERMHITSSSRGAAKYLKRNNQYTKNWIYALMSYYTGLGGARPLLNEKYVGSDKMVIDGKTHWYVLKFLAHLVAYGSASIDQVQAPYRLVEYTRCGNMTMKEIASYTRTEVDLLKSFNRWLKAFKVPTDREYAAILPLQAGVQEPQGPLADQQKAEPSKTRSQPHTPDTHRERRKAVKEKQGPFTISIEWNGIPAVLATKNSSVQELAFFGGVEKSAFLKYNDLSLADKLVEGQLYYLKAKKRKALLPFHVLGKNESLWEVSQKYGIKLKRIYWLNRMEEGQTPPVGTKLWLRKRRPNHLPPEIISLERAQEENADTQFPVVTHQPKLEEAPLENDVPEAANKPAEEPKTDSLVRKPEVAEFYLVEKGETLFSISKRFGLSLAEIKTLNGLENESIRIGQVLRVKKSVQSVPAEFILHKVQPGETMYRISKMYNIPVQELQQLNGKSDYTLTVGEVLKIHLK